MSSVNGIMEWDVQRFRKRKFYGTSESGYSKLAGDMERIDEGRFTRKIT